MTQKLRLIRTAAVVVFIVPAFGVAVAQDDSPKTAVQKGAVAPITVQTAPVVKDGPVSRPGKGVGPLAPQGVISVLLTEAECKGLGGTVKDVPTSECASGKGCYTADQDGVMRGLCIKKL